MRTSTPALILLSSALVLSGFLQAAPRGGVAKAGKDEPQPAAEQGSQPSPSQQGMLPPPKLERRIVTKINGVVVEERDGTPVDAPLLPSAGIMPQSNNTQSGMPGNPLPRETEPLKPEGVVYESASLELEADPSVSEFADEAPVPIEVQPENSFLGGMFNNFMSPSRQADSNRMRSGKGRGMHLAPTGSSVPEYPLFMLPKPPEDIFIAPSTNLILGRLMAVNSQTDIAVAWMETRFIALDREVVSRNHELQETGVLKPTHFRNGRAYGLKVVSGNPGVGEEIILKNATAANRRQDELSYQVSLTVGPAEGK